MQSDTANGGGNAQARSQVRAEGGENMTNTALLNQLIEESGKKIGYLAEKCGLSRQGFDNCRNNKAQFNAKQIKILCFELNIRKLSVKERVFFAH